MAVIGTIVAFIAAGYLLFKAGTCAVSSVGRYYRSVRILFGVLTVLLVLVGLYIFTLGPLLMELPLWCKIAGAIYGFILVSTPIGVIGEFRKQRREHAA